MQTLLRLYIYLLCEHFARIVDLQHIEHYCSYLVAFDWKVASYQQAVCFSHMFELDALVSDGPQHCTNVRVAGPYKCVDSSDD